MAVISTMNMKELVLAVSAETNVPAAQVRKVATSVLAKFADLIETEGRFTSPKVNIIGVVAPAKPAMEDKPERPARKYARIHLRSKVA